MAFLGGLIGGAAKGVAARHAEQRKFDQEQKIQDTRIRDESSAKQDEATTNMQIDMIMKSPNPWPQKAQQMSSLMQRRGHMSSGQAQEFTDSMRPAGVLHEAYQQGNLPGVPNPSGSPAAMPSPVNSDAFSSSVPSQGGDGEQQDPMEAAGAEAGKHVGTAFAQHQIMKGDPSERSPEATASILPSILGYASKKQKELASSGGAPDSGSPAPVQAPGASSPVSSAAPQTSPSSALPTAPDTSDSYNSSPLLDYQNALEEGKSKRDINKINATENAKFNRTKNTLALMKEAGGGDQNEPTHFKLSANGNPEYDAGKLHTSVAQGSEIDQKVQYKGGPAIDSNAFYRGTKFADGAVHWQKIPGVKGRVTVQDSSSPTGWSTVATMAGGQVSNDPELRSPVAPPASQARRETERQQSVIDPNTGQRVNQTLRSTSGPVNPPQPGSNIPTPSQGASPADLAAIGAPNAPPAPPPNSTAPYSNTPAPGPQGAQGRPVPGSGFSAPIPSAPSAVPPGIAAMADMWQNDPTTAKALMANYPRNSPQKILIQKEVERRLTAGEGPVPVFLGTSARNQSQQAKLMAPEIDQTVKDIDRLAPKLGPVMGRWNEFLAGRVGTSDPEFAKLRSDLSLIKSKVAQIHFGTASGVQAAERFDKLLTAQKMDAPTLQAGMASLSQILKLYGSLNVTAGAAMQQGGANSSKATPNSGVPAQRKSLVDIFGK